MHQCLCQAIALYLHAYESTSDSYQSLSSEWDYEAWRRNQEFLCGHAEGLDAMAILDPSKRAPVAAMKCDTIGSAVSTV